MKKRILSSIIVFTAKDKKFLPSCLKSLEKSAYIASRPLEIILVANGTTHLNYGFLHSSVKKILIKKNIGFGMAVNQAMKQAKGDWCIMVCPDVITDNNTLKNIFPRTAEKRIGLIAPKILLPDNSPQTTLLPYPDVFNIFIEQSFLYRIIPWIFKSPLSYLPLYESRKEVQAVAAIWWLINKKAFVDTGGFDNRFFLYFEDLDFCLRLKKRNYAIVFEPSATARHLPHQSTGGETSGKLYYQSLKKFLHKHHAIYYAQICLSVFKFGTFFRIIYWGLNILVFRDKSQIGKNKLMYLSEIIQSR